MELSVRYLPGRYLPDKAIDLLDEAAASVRIRCADRRSEPLPELKPSDIARVVSKASGVPVERVGEAERERLYQLEDRLSQEVIGQPRAVKAVAAIRRSRTGLRESGRPIGAMLFLGPTGVGKTQLARTLAKSWFGSEKALLRFDMSEYMEQHTVARMIGSPPGYVGHDEGGQLTEAVRRRPYSVVLFDEIEKAHTDIQNVLLQILEDGCLTDAQGRKADLLQYDHPAHLQPGGTMPGWAELPSGLWLCGGGIRSPCPESTAGGQKLFPPRTHRTGWMRWCFPILSAPSS